MQYVRMYTRIMWASDTCVCTYLSPQSHTASGKNKDLVKELRAYEVGQGVHTACTIWVPHPLCGGWGWGGVSPSHIYLYVRTVHVATVSLMQASVRQEYDTVYVDADDGYVYRHTSPHHTSPHHITPHHNTTQHTSPHHTTPHHTT